MEIILKTDGASNLEDKLSSCSWIIFENDKVVKKNLHFLNGNEAMTSNQEEYRGVLFGLKEIINMYDNLSKNDNILIETDSELLVKQLTGIYKVSSKNLKQLNKEVKDLVKNIKAQVEIKHVPREENKMADKLAKRGLLFAKKIKELS